MKSSLLIFAICVSLIWKLLVACWLLSRRGGAFRAKAKGAAAR